MHVVASLVRYSQHGSMKRNTVPQHGLLDFSSKLRFALGMLNLYREEFGYSVCTFALSLLYQLLFPSCSQTLQDLFPLMPIAARWSPWRRARGCTSATGPTLQR